MPLAFDVDTVGITEFGVGRDEEEGQTFSLVPVDTAVQNALREMVTATRNAMTELNDNPPAYEPSEKHAASEYVVVPLADDLANALRQLHQATNVPVTAAALSDPKAIFCYFARMTDGRGRRVTAVRRATQFKGVLKSRLVRVISDALGIIEDSVFRLDNDFDLLIDDGTVHILRPAGFEFVGQLQQAVLSAAPTNVKAIRKDLPFVDFSQIEAYATMHPRAARYLASIHAQNVTKNIDKSALKALCKRTGVEVKESKGKIVIENDNVMAFLEVLDRRRYQVELVKGAPESFRAGSRQKLGT